MTTQTTQEQDLRTALDKLADEMSGNEIFFGAEASDLVSIHRRISAVLPRPVDAERVEEPAEIIARLEKELGVTGTANVFREALRLAKAARDGRGEDVLTQVFASVDIHHEVSEYEFAADEGYYKPNEREQTILEDFGCGLLGQIEDVVRVAMRMALASPAHAPDKAVTREGVDARDRIAAILEAEMDKQCWGKHYDAVADMILAALAPRPTGTEAARGGPIETAPKDGRVLLVKNRMMQDFVEARFGEFKDTATGMVSEQWILVRDLSDASLKMRPGTMLCPTEWEPATPTPSVPPSPDSTGPAEETEEELDERIARMGARENMRLIDSISDLIGLPHNVELELHHVRAALTPSAPITDPSLDSTGQGDALAEVIAALDAAEIQECHVDGDKADVISAPPGSNCQNEYRLIARCATGELWVKQAVAIAKSINFVRSLATVSQGDAQTQEGGIWPSGCIKPNACARHRMCVYAMGKSQCRHYGEDLTALVEPAPPAPADRSEGGRNV